MIQFKYPIITYSLLAIFGAGYFLCVSQIDVSFAFLKIYTAMVPIQLAALIYVAWIIRKHKYREARDIESKSHRGMNID